jgi:hypothetical protein
LASAASIASHIRPHTRTRARNTREGSITGVYARCARLSPGPACGCSRGCSTGRDSRGSGALPNIHVRRGGALQVLEYSPVVVVVVTTTFHQKKKKQNFDFSVGGSRHHYHHYRTRQILHSNTFLPSSPSTVSSNRVQNPAKFSADRAKSYIPIPLLRPCVCRIQAPTTLNSTLRYLSNASL